MSGLVRHRRPWRRLAVLGGLLALAAGLTATLAAALQVRQVRVEGSRRFPAADIERALQYALGSTTLTVRAADLRAIVSEVPWVADAAVRVTLDGTVHCTVREREPVALARDGERTSLADREGNLLGPARGTLPELEIDGFAPYPGERTTVLGAVEQLERAWGARLTLAERIGPADVALHFAGAPFPVVANPGRSEQVSLARRVLEAWLREGQKPPLRLDARADGRVAVLPAPPPEEDAS